MVDDGARPHVRGDLQYSELEDGAVVYDAAAGRIYTLNLTAAYIWNYCDGSHTLEQMARALLEQVKLSAEKALADVQDAITCFHHEGLLRSQ